MDESLFERPQRLALAPEILAQRLAEIQAQPNGLEAAMAFLQTQAELQERDRAAELEWRERHPEVPSAEQAVAEFEEHVHVAPPKEVEPASIIVDPAPAIERDFEPVTASTAIAASGPIPLVLRRPNFLRDLSWLTFVLASGFLASLAGSSILGDVGNSPAALLPLISVFAPVSIVVAGVFGLGIYLGARFQTGLGELLAMPYGVLGAWAVRIAGVAAVVSLAWMITGQLGFTITGAAGELFQGSAIVVNFAQTGRLAAIALAVFALVAASARLAPRLVRVALRALSALLLIALLADAGIHDAPSFGAIFGTAGYIASSPQSVSGYAIDFLLIGFAAAFEFGSKIPAQAARTRGITVITVSLAVLPTLVAALLALVNPISTPKLLSMLDLAFIPVGCIALFAVALRSIRSLSGGGRAATAVAVVAGLALIVLPLILNAQTDGSQLLIDTASVILAVVTGQSTADLLQRRNGTHVASLKNRRGIYRSLNVFGLVGFVGTALLGLLLLPTLGSLGAASSALATAAAWQLSAGRVLTRRQDRELAGRNSRMQSLFDEVIA